MPQRQLQGFLAPAAQRGRAVSGSTSGAPSIPRQLRQPGSGSFVAEGDVEGVAARETQSGDRSDQIVRRRPARAERKDVGVWPGAPARRAPS